MKTKLLFSKIQYCKNAIFTLLFIFIMTVSSFGQQNGIEFEFECPSLDPTTYNVNFGTPDILEDENGFPRWSFNLESVGLFSLYVECGVNCESPLVWELRGPGGPGGDIVYFSSDVFVNDFPSCDANDWLIGPNIPCSVSTITCPQPTPTWYQDSDMDTFGNPLVSQMEVSQPTGYVADNTDCDDTNGSINPGATDIPDNGIDENCDGSDALTWYADADSDTYGDLDVTQVANTKPSGFVTDNTDCDDIDAAVNPGATEICDGIDNNCDGNSDEGLDFTTYYVDADSDGYGTTAEDICSLTAPSGYATVDGDCDDTDDTIYPGATEIPDDGIDQDCDGVDDVSSTNEYVIVARKEIHLHGNNTVIGNIGATKYDGKVKLHDVTNVSGSVEASDIDIDDDSSAGSIILEPAVVDLPPFVFNSVSKNSNLNITVEPGQTVTLDDQVYRKIKVKHGGSVIFTNSNVYLKRLKTYDNAIVDFQNEEGCTNLFINKKVKMEDNTSFNSSGTNVTLFVDDKVAIEEGSNVTAYIYANKYIEVKGQNDNRTYMSGFFSGKKVVGEENVSWVGQTSYTPCEIVEPDDTDEDVCDCKGGMVSLTFAYSGIYDMLLTTNSGYIIDNYDGTYTVYNDGEKLEKNLEISDGDLDIDYDDDDDDDDGDDDDDLGSSSFATIHTSCSKEILGVTYDGVFTVVSHTDNNGNICESNVSARSSVVNRIDSVKSFSGFEIRVWPNPSENNFNVRVTTIDDLNKIDIQVIDITGKRIHADTIRWNNDYEFGEELQSGIYFVKITQANTTEVIKVIKQ